MVNAEIAYAMALIEVRQTSIASATAVKTTTTTGRRNSTNNDIVAMVATEK